MGVTSTVQARKVRDTATEWLSYGGDKAGSKYSPLAQTGRDNFDRRKVAWTWRSADEELAKANHLKTWVWEATPLMADGVLFGTGDGYPICLNAQTGKPISTFGQQGRIDLTPRRRGDGVKGSRFSPREGDAARRCAGLRCPHRQAAVALPCCPPR